MEFLDMEKFTSTVFFVCLLVCLFLLVVAQHRLGHLEARGGGTIHASRATDVRSAFLLAVVPVLGRFVLFGIRTLGHDDAADRGRAAVLARELPLGRVRDAPVLAVPRALGLARGVLELGRGWGRLRDACREKGQTDQAFDHVLMWDGGAN